MKKMIALLLSFVLITVMFPCSLAQEVGDDMMGDVNYDAKLDAKDALSVLKFAVGLETPTPEQATLADMNGDGKIMARDGMLILRNTGIPPLWEEETVTQEKDVAITLSGKNREGTNDVVTVTVALQGEDLSIGSMDLVWEYDPQELQWIETENYNVCERLKQGESSVIAGNFNNNQIAVASAFGIQQGEFISCDFRMLKFPGEGESISLTLSLRDDFLHRQKNLVQYQVTVQELNITDYAVEDLICAISKLPDGITLQQETPIVECFQRYEQLTDLQKSRIENAQKLQTAKRDLAVLMIENLPLAITKKDAKTIDLVENLYNTLGEQEQKTVENYDLLVQAKEVIEKFDSIVYGDVNTDGKVNAQDALGVLKFAVGKGEFTALQRTTAQVDGKDGINAKDALEILKFAVEKISVFPVETL